MCSATDKVHETENGDTFDGYTCREKLCVGSWVVSAWDDPHTQVCNDNQYFVYATSLTKSDWVNFYGEKLAMNCIIGLGKEQASSASKSFLGYAKYNGDLENLIYSLEMAPVTAQMQAELTHRKLKAAVRGTTT